jgi:hypothetical protein
MAADEFTGQFTTNSKINLDYTSGQDFRKIYMDTCTDNPKSDPLRIN